MSSKYYRLKPEGSTYISNDVPYPDEASLYGTASGPLSSGRPGKNHRDRTGIAITVSVPPTLRAVRFPNLVGNNVTPYIESSALDTLAIKSDWYKAVKANSGAKRTNAITTINRQINKYERLYNQAVKNNNTTSANAYKEKIDKLKKQLKSLKNYGTSTDIKLYDLFTTEFEISDFVKSLSWSSSRDNAYVEVSLELDNLQGIFNFLPEIAKITIWRRKSGTPASKSNLYSGKWYRYITCYVTEKSQSISARSNTMSLTCWDRAGFLASQISSKKQWVKGKTAHKDGWTPREITIDICKREGIPYNSKKIPKYIVYKKVTKLPNGGLKREYVKKLIPKIEYTGQESSKLTEAISGAWNQAIKKLPVNQQYAYCIHMRQGVLEVEIVAAPGEAMTQTDAEGQRQLAVFTDENISSASLRHSIDSDSTFTVLKATGKYRDGYKTNKKGKKVPKYTSKTITFYPSSFRGKLLLRAYGKLQQERSYDSIIFKNKKDFMRTAQSDLDKIHSRPLASLSIDDARAPLGIWPIKYVTVNSRELGVKGNIMVNTVNYNVENGIIKVSSIDLEIAYKHFSSGESAYKYPPLEERWY